MSLLEIIISLTEMMDLKSSFLSSVAVFFGFDVKYWAWSISTSLLADTVILYIIKQILGDAILTFFGIFWIVPNYVWLMQRVPRILILKVFM